MYSRTLELAHEHQHEAFYWFERADEADRMGLYSTANRYESYAEEHARLAAEYYCDAECHDWSKRG